MRAIRFSTVSSASAMTHWNIFCADKAASLSPPPLTTRTHTRTHTHTGRIAAPSVHRDCAASDFGFAEQQAGRGLNCGFFFSPYVAEVGTSIKSEAVERLRLRGKCCCRLDAMRRDSHIYPPAGKKHTKFIDKRLNFCAFFKLWPPPPPPPPPLPPPLTARPDALQSQERRIIHGGIHPQTFTVNLIVIVTSTTC